MLNFKTLDSCFNSKAAFGNTPGEAKIIVKLISSIGFFSEKKKEAENEGELRELKMQREAIELKTAMA